MILGKNRGQADYVSALLNVTVQSCGFFFLPIYGTLTVANLHE